MSSTTPVPSLRRRVLHAGRDLLAFAYTRVLLAWWPAAANAIYEGLSYEGLRYLLGHRVIGRAFTEFDWSVTLANGRAFAVHVDPSDVHSVGCAFEYKTHDVGLKRTQEFFLDRLTARSVYLDIGANVGVSSVYALSLGRACWLFEPNEALHAFGRALFARNGFTTARWEAVALSDRSGEARFFVSRSSYLSSFDPNHAAREGEAREIVVPMRPLDAYVAELRALADEVLVKIDVEGHEMQVLAGGAGVLEHYRPVVMIELLPDDGARGDAWAWFAARGYVGFRVFDEPVLRVGRLPDLGALRAAPEINFVFLPADHRLRAEFERHA